MKKIFDITYQCEKQIFHKLLRVKHEQLHNEIINSYKVFDFTNEGTVSMHQDGLVIVEFNSFSDCDDNEKKILTELTGVLCSQKNSSCRILKIKFDENVI